MDTRRPIAILALMLFAWPLNCRADEAKTADKTRAIQAIERLIASSAATGDEVEMLRQVEALDKIQPYFAGKLDDFVYGECGRALGGIRSYARLYFVKKSARMYLKAQDGLLKFRAYMPDCERPQSLRAPPPPNLR